jgi:O-acetyl-ADP-ribose deacetylase (regulator of RNase III)
MEEMMLFEDDPRDIRKKEFIERIRRRKSGELIGPLSKKIAAWEKGDIDSSEVFRAAGYAGRKGDAIIADFKKRPDVILAGIAMDENRYITSIGEIGVEVRLSDITEVFSDAIVTSVEPDGSMAAGSGSLTAENVIHAAVRDGSGAVTPGSVTAALSAALKEAEALEAETVAVPGLGYVDGGIGAEESAASVISALENHSGESINKVLLVDIAEEVVSAFVAALKKRDEE